MNLYLFWFNKSQTKGDERLVYIRQTSRYPSQPRCFPVLFVTGIVGSLNSENKVDLTNPQYTVVVEIIKAVCCLSVVKDYMLFRKYNLQEVVKSAKDPPQLKSKQTAQAGNGKEPKLETVDRSNQNDPAEEKK